jgi:beta-lactamase superfamily II metal-dependent hydrolase
MNKISFLRRKVLFIISAVFLFCTLASCTKKQIISSPDFPGGSITIHFIDVGLGDSAFIVLPSGQNMLLDFGGPAAGPKVAKYIKSLGIDRIDHLILTHPDDDHMGGIFSVLAEFETYHIYDNGLNNFSSNIYKDYITSVRKDLSKYNILQAGESLFIDGVDIEVLNPLLPPTGNSNDDSIVMKITHGDIKILLTGDLGNRGEKRLLRLGKDLSGHILKVGHHGDNDACSQEFLERVRPETAVISVSSINSYLRPHPDVLSRLKNSGAKIFRTDLHGDIVLRSNGRTYSIKTEK